VGLVARAIEEVGIPTVALSIVKEVTEKTPPPRALYLHFPFGHALGEVGNRAQQLTLLLRAFQLLLSAEVPGTIIDSGLHWRREQYTVPAWEDFKELTPGFGE
jgi:D-proline reductase (dithiol) PrdB